jgi:hypothetical protein
VIPTPPKPKQHTKEASGQTVTVPIDFGTAYRPLRESVGSSLHFKAFSAGLVVAAILVASIFMQQRPFFGAILIVTAIDVGLLIAWRQAWLHFTEEWTLAELHLQPSTRNAWPRSLRSWSDVWRAACGLPRLLIGRAENAGQSKGGMVESIAILLLMFLCLFLVPQFLASDLAFLILVGLCIVVCLTLAETRSASDFKALAHQFYRLRKLWFTYPDRFESQAGLWTAPHTLLIRQGIYVVVIGFTYLYVSIVLTGETAILSRGFLLLASPLVAELILFTYLLPELLQLRALERTLATHDHDARCPWQQLVDRKLGSIHPPERSGLLWGLDVETLEPILVKREILANHVHIRGATGSGKTSGSLIPLALQLLDTQARPVAEANGRRDPLIVVDFGGDQPMFHAVRQEAERQGRKFRFFSVQNRHASDFFDPLQCLLSDELRDPQLASMFVEAFNLDYGLRYGAQYFTEQNLHSLITVLHHYRLQQDRHPTLQSLYQFLRDNQHKAEFRNSEQIMMCIGFLLDYPQLTFRQSNPTADDHIYMPRVLEDGEVVYFFLPTLNEAAFVREIAGLALYSLLAAAMERSHTGSNAILPSQAWVIIDEFQELAGASFANLLVQTRKFGLGLILANQSTAQLDNRDVNLAELTEENTDIRQYFTVTADDISSLQKLSGEEERLRTTFRDGEHATSQVWVREPTLELNAILETSGKRMESFLIVRDGEGAAKPRRIVSMYPMTLDEYERLRHLPLPRRAKPRSESTHSAPVDEPACYPPTDTVTPVENLRRKRLATLWEKYQAEQRFAPPRDRKKTKDP